jgi:hypothetical protein
MTDTNATPNPIPASVLSTIRKKANKTHTAGVKVPPPVAPPATTDDGDDAPAPAGLVAVYSESARKDGNAELRCNGKPPAAVRLTLVGAGLRWGKADRCWYGADDAVIEALGMLETKHGASILSAETPRAAAALAAAQPQMAREEGDAPRGAARTAKPAPLSMVRLNGQTYLVRQIGSDTEMIGRVVPVDQ